MGEGEVYLFFLGEKSYVSKELYWGRWTDYLDFKKVMEKKAGSVLPVFSQRKGGVILFHAGKQRSAEKNGASREACFRPTKKRMKSEGEKREPKNHISAG